MPRIVVPLPLADRPFAVDEAHRAGLGIGRLRGPDLAAPHRGVRYVVDGHPDPDDVPRDLAVRARDVLPVMLDDWRFSRVTALGLWGLPVPWWVRDGREPLHVTSIEGRGPRRPGVATHRAGAAASRADPTDRRAGLGPSDRPPMSRVDGLPVDEPVTAWVECGSLLSLTDLVRAGDALAGCWSPHVAARERPVAQFERALHDARGRRGVARVREAFELVRPGVESPKETELRLLLTRAGLPEPEINVRTFDDRGRYLGKPDLRYARCEVAVEYEGDEHRRDPGRFRQDILRRERFADAGWRTVRCTDDDLHGRRADELVARVRRLLS
ncbi:hypothetical protein [Frigoribacterium sp. PhB118]|uniref:hypothetical protein n=1 Tax=Frigoribacterium sp. PhB118 TaxID=2485175 RepID=UPI000F45F10A|nr:hypothetical protein [Frigoribacterium sp. PhB118]ROS54050.1 hypothetical protein EDF21_1911 [Frigoribacterium sp. PhB118]